MYELIIATTFCEIIFNEQVSERVRNLRLDTLEKIFHALKFYESKQIRSDLLNTIAEKKCKLLLEITSVAELKKLSNPPAPYYNGATFVLDPLLIPEEELILWNMANNVITLNDVGRKRYIALMKQIFPGVLDE